MSITLMKHQEEALEFLSTRPQAGLFFEMGLGKTAAILEHLHRNRQKLPCLIVAPLSVVSVWGRESEKFGYDFKFSNLVGTRADRKKALAIDADFYVINYEGMRILKPELMAKGFSSIVLDESHRAGKRSSQQTQAALQLAATIQNRYILTGTPMTNTPEDLWSQIHFLKPGFLSNFYAFQSRYVEFKSMTIRTPSGLRDIKKPYRFRYLKELNERISGVCLRKTKEECLDLPDKVYKTIPCQMGKEQSDAYYLLKHSLAAMINEKTVSINSAAAAVQKMKQICQGFIYDVNGEAHYYKENGKLDVLMDLMEDLKNEKVIIFTYYRAENELLYEELSKKFKVLLYDGDSEARQILETSFQESKEPVIFLGNIDKAKEGITLTAASNVIYFGNSYSYGARYQSEDRAHRKGQTKNVVYHDLVCSNTIDERVVAILNHKKHSADLVTGDSMRLARMAADIE